MASRIAPIPLRHWLIRNVGWVAAAALVAAVGFLPTAPPVLGSAPPAHKVEICHATPPDTAANGWHMIEVDVASVGYQHSGHQDKHDADIIPPYSYDGFSFTGKNWTAEGQAIWANDCRAVTPTPTVTPTDEPTVTPTDEPTTTPTDEPTITPTDEPTATPTGEPTATPTGNVLPTEDTATPTPTGNVLPAEGTPAPTLPPTDTTSATSGSVSMAALFLIIAMLAAVTGSLVTIDRSIRRVR